MSALSSSGAFFTIASLMPVSSVILAGMGRFGFTKVEKVSTTCPPRSFTAPISVMASFAAESPVVSRSKQMKVPSLSFWSAAPDTEDISP